MKFRVERDVLADAAAWVARSLPARPPVPVLGGVVLEATSGPSGDRLTVSGFDYETSARVELDATIGDPGRVLVSGRLLADITKALPAKPVDVVVDGSRATISCGNSRFSLPTMPVEDYPQLPAMPQVAGVVAGDVLAQAVQQVAVAAGRDDTLPILTGIRVEIEGDTVTLAATDRYRLAIREISWEPAEDDVDTTALVPARTLADTAKTLGPLGGSVTVALATAGAGEGMIGFAGPARRTTSRLLDGQSYPPVRSLFPASFAAEARVPVSALVEVVKRVSLVAEKATPIRLSFSDDGLVVEAGGSEEARASEAMEASFTGESLVIAFNPQYLIDGLGALNAPTAVFGFTDSFKPAVLMPAGDDGEVVPGYRYLIMPIRVGR
jgi:DNA polymerase-3 subunit beta